jgi:hypothetical protein
MKEYQSIEASLDGFDLEANKKAKDGWRVASVVPLQYGSKPDGMDLERVFIIMERDKRNT